MGDGKPAFMKWTMTTRVFAVGSVAVLVLCACKSGKQSATAAEPAREAPSALETVRLHGMYSYMADASLFVDCATGERWPVATEGDNAALERAYLEGRAAPGAPLPVTVEGHLESRPKMDGPGKETVLIVERFVGVSPRRGCENMDAITLEDTRWELLELNATPIVVKRDGKAPYLELNSKKGSAYGFGGCNRFFGSYESTGQTLKDREQELFATLGTVTRYEIHGTTLLLFAGDKLVARFEARPSVE
jgi:hypothetical protein